MVGEAPGGPPERWEPGNITASAWSALPTNWTCVRACCLPSSLPVVIHAFFVLNAMSVLLIVMQRCGHRACGTGEVASMSNYPFQPGNVLTWVPDHSIVAWNPWMANL